MPTYVLFFSDPNCSLETVGGKGFSLSKMTRAGLPIPNGYHISTEAYRQFVAENGIQTQILDALKGIDAADPNTLEPVSDFIGGLFAKGHIPNEITESVLAAYATLKGAPVAVRSSATAEDLPDASFAGQQDTYLNIRGADALLNAVKKCWASLWTARAIAYRARQGIDPQSVALAVVVQWLVFADAAGVMFTANPISGKRDEIMITAAWGLGEALVSGVVTPDTLTVDKATGRLVRREIAEKAVMTVRTETGTSLTPVPNSKKKKAVLTNAQAAELAKLGAQIEHFYEMPMDVEWTLTGGKLAIVQARPITALPEVLEWKLPVPGAVLARGSFAEFVPEPVSPLFATLAIPIARKTTIDMMGGFGLTGENSYLFAVLNDYVYIGFVFSLKMVWQMTKTSFSMLGPILKNSVQRAAVARENLLGVAQKWQARELSVLAPSELLTGVREIFTETSRYYNMAQSGTIPTSMGSEMIFGAFYNLLVKRKSEPKAEVFVFGTENHAMQADKALYDLAIWIRTQPELADYLSRTPAEDVAVALQAAPLPVSAFDEFSTRFGIYLREYGYAIYDLDFAKPTPSDAPAPLIETLKVYLDGKNNPYERQRAALDLREKAAETIAKRLDPLRRKYFLQLLRWAQDTAHLREDSIADLGLGYPQIRRMLGELGRRLAEEGAIACADDVYWLEAEETDAQVARLEKSQTPENFADKIEQRKAKWQAMRRIVPPNILPRVSWLSKFYADNEQTGSKIKGFGASAGRVTARACIMLGPEDFSKMQPGDVIVAGITTPAWTPLFARASAIVTDIGGPLSHSSIVAREYGIPAVLATGVGTRRITEGQMITVDGTAGLVEIVSIKPASTLPRV